VIALIQRSDYVKTLMGVIPPADFVDNLVMTPGVSQTVNVPSEATMVLMTAEMPYFVKYGPGPIAIPTANIEAGTGLDLNPTGRRLDVTAITAISVVARIAGIVQLAFYNG
jgi:hypothetical protein